MFSFKAAELADVLSGKLLQGKPDAVFKSVSTDTRTISKGQLFIALKGERFDAHDFIDKAISAGAAGLVISRRVETHPWQGPVILVDDTLQALQKLAAYNRRFFKGIVVGVTGSNGKTTTKDMINAVLGQKYRTLKTQGNFNNHIGLPLTLLQLDENYDAVVLEMGMRGLKEIDLLAGIAKPTGAVITNVGESHLERLGTIENIAWAKGEILDHITEEGFAVLNGDDIMVRNQAGRCIGRVRFYGTSEDVSIKASHLDTDDGKTTAFVVSTPEGIMKVRLPVPGRHNVYNALAAVGVGLEAGVPLADIVAGLADLKLTPMRLEILEGKKGITVINDTYNANPSSMKAALDVLADIGKGMRKVAILGDMFELGHQSAEGHREIGEKTAANQIEVLITVGEMANEIALGASLAEYPPLEILSFNTNAQVIEYLDRIIRPGDAVLVKGSRLMKMEHIVNSLVE